MQLLLVDVVLVSLASEVFLFFIHVIHARLELLEHEGHVRLWLRRKCLLILYRLRVEVKDDDVLIHPVPLAREYFCPELLGKANEKGERSIEIIHGYFR